MKYRLTHDLKCRFYRIRAFTLLECILVVSVLAIILALLIPAVFALRNSANSVKCVNNLKQIGTTVRSYLNDHKGILPNLPLVPRNQNEIAIFFESYAQGNPAGSWPVLQHWICPSDPTKGGWSKYGARYGFSGEENEVGFLAHSYMPNRLVLGFGLHEIPRLSQTILFADFPWSDLSTRAIVPMDSPWKESYPKQWHQGNLNCLFVDGHIERLPIDSLVWGGNNTRLWYVDYPTSGTYFRE